MSDVIYLDHNASTPCDPRVVEAMLPFFTENYANPTSRSHTPGRQAFTTLEGCRRIVAKTIGAARATEITFTSGATESNNTAIFGLALALKDRGRHIITQATEHPSVLEPVAQLAKKGWHTTFVPVDTEGIINLEALEAAIRPDTTLITLMLANNETGTIQPIHEAARIAHRNDIVIHTDAAQAVGKIPVSIDELGIDALSLSSHKFYGPKGSGVLYVKRRKLQPKPVLVGGGQEYGLRSGTVNLPAVVGMAKAMEICDVSCEQTQLSRLRDRLEAKILNLGGVHINGSITHRLPGTSNLSFEGIDGEALLASLPGLALSSGSACASTTPEPSTVLRAMGVASKLARASLRLSVGRFTSADEVEYASDRIIEEVTRLRQSSRRRTS